MSFEVSLKSGWVRTEGRKSGIHAARLGKNTMATAKIDRQLIISWGVLLPGLFLFIAGFLEI